MSVFASMVLYTFTFSPDVSRDLFTETLTKKSANDLEEAANCGSIELTVISNEDLILDVITK